MNCPKCGFHQPPGRTECARCGVLFEKYARLHANPADEIGFEWEPDIEDDDPPAPGIGQVIQGILLHEPEVPPLFLAGRMLLLLILAVWGLRLGLSSIEGDVIASCFLHNVNLPFHEAGHIFFRPFGRFVTVLGGTLGQLLMPLICLGVFLKERRPFAAAVALWWFGENFIDIAPYINDARRQELILLGGVTGKDVPGYHDWAYILGQLGWRQYDHLLARASHITGFCLIILSLAWAAWLLYRQVRQQWPAPSNAP